MKRSFGEVGLDVSLDLSDFDAMTGSKVKQKKIVKRRMKKGKYLFLIRSQVYVDWNVYLVYLTSKLD